MQPWSHDFAGRLDQHVFASEVLWDNPLGDPHERPLWVDAWTSLGGSQFLDSPGTGRYHTYLCEEVVPWVDERYRTLAAREHRGIAGKSSGGYGAMVTPMLRPDLFGALATHAGDALFEACYTRDFFVAARALRDEYESSYERFWGRLPFARSVPAGARAGRHRPPGRPLRALRRHAHVHRVPLSAGARVPRTAPLAVTSPRLAASRPSQYGWGEGGRN